MESFLFSSSSLIGSDVYMEPGIVIGVLEDIIGNHSNSSYTYLIISAGLSDSNDTNLYAIHYSYFILNPSTEQMVFTPRNGSKRTVHLPVLPTTYDSLLVLSYQEFKVNILPYIITAGHRSDNE